MQHWRKLPTKQNHLSFQVKTFYYVLLNLFMFSLIACNQSSPNGTKISDPENTESGKAAVPNKLLLSFDTLSVLYIENDTLKTLLGPPRPPRKLILEFYKTSMDSITLLVWGERNTSARQLDKKFTLKTGTEVRRFDTTQNKNVIIGSIEMTNTGNGSDLARLKDTLNLTTPHKYILFEPLLLPCTEPSCMAGDYIIKYKLWGSDTTLINPPQKFTTASTLDITANPSPPARRL